MPRRYGVYALALFLAGVMAGGGGVLAWERGPGLRLRPPPDAAPPRRWEATLYLPVTDGDGRRFSADSWQAALSDLVGRFRGATLGPEQEGWWVDGRNQIHREPVRPVTVSFERHRLDEFRASVREVGRRLGQVEIYVRLEEPRVEVLPVGEGSAGAR
jgi:hypothetical protein